ncbi:winged helix-turn-helix domain-containing protein [Arthrobacter sp. CAU 1506]|uniref:winged helix-turn-helix domain-containing protein n=1 Tax=Arthrobacter sp. CAU 1506 TaxID=2560052 RepID=UPI0010AC259B|nr:crosslink repair DNA glycosylase YcaQ family protein [Arthrobacter sp. CAU 1506]TJY71271.1 winged helix-turn-helix domain-containing protein [Arthrobacter sp. CAU 1506]
MTARISPAQARRIALAAQGLAKERPTGLVTARQVGRTFDRIRLLQIDSVNVLVRSHYLPFFSRLGGYDVDILHRLAGKAPRRMIEYWAHEASYIKPEDFADLRQWQRRHWVGAAGMDPDVVQDLTARILAALASSRGLTARAVADRIGHEETRSTTDWGWNWNAVKRVLEALFEEGLVSAAARTPQFERLYTLTEKVLPAPYEATHRPHPEEAMLRLIEAAARAHGIGTVKCFADYYRVPARAAAGAVQALEADGTLERVQVDGWKADVYLHGDAARPRRVAGRALLSPFDSMVFERQRVEQLFGFRYRIEIYTPAEKRTYGYYVLPFLLGDRLCARVDLKADRSTGRLVVRSAHSEADAPAETAAELAAELAAMAGWLKLDTVAVEDSGDLAAGLGREVARRARGNQNSARHVSHVD